MATQSPGSQLGRYEIVGPLGSGGMGVVYRARDPQLDRDVAIKLLPEKFADDEGRLARFEREAKATAALNHPNLLAIHDVGVHEGAPYLVCELLEGETLRERLSRGPLDWPEALAITTDISSGLAAAHGKGVVHRDLKPDNIFLLEDGRAKILDFGLATFATEGQLAEAGLTSEQTLEQLTDEGVVLGTVGYMSPEQVGGRPTDARSDLFSLGVILYEMLSGSAPFRRDTAIESLHAILKEEPHEVRSDTEFPSGVSRLVSHLMEKKPSARFQSARDLLYDLDGIEQRSSSGLRTAEVDQRSRRWLLPVAAGLAIVVAGVFLLRQGDHDAEPQQPPGAAAPERSIAIAVLPFEERGGPSEQAHLALGLPDEIVTTLSYAKNLAVRSFTQSSRFAAPLPELSEIGEALGANHLVIGQFGLEGEAIRVSVETVDVETNEVVWRDSWVAAGDDLLGLRETLREKVSGGLLSALGRGAGGPARRSGAPRSAEAYDLYLRAAAISVDPVENKEGIELLERVVELDPEFAEAWLRLAGRYYYDSLLSETVELAAAERAHQYGMRALALDPDSVGAMIFNLERDIEAGKHVEGFQRAVELIRQRPDHGSAHMTLAYVLRYGGALEESAQECREAQRLDPEGKYAECQWTFSHLGDYETAFQYIADNVSPTLKKSLRADMLMRMGDREAARAQLADASDELAAMDIQKACLAMEQPAELAGWIADRHEQYSAWPDPEAIYWYSALLSDCGFPDEAISYLELSLDRNYCVPAALDNDPLWDPIRGAPGFLAQRQRAIDCHQRFMAERAG